MQIANSYPCISKEISEILGHLLRKGRYQCTFILLSADTNLIHEVIDLILNRFQYDLRIDQSRWADYLFDKFSPGLLHLIRPRSCREIDLLWSTFQEFLKR